MKPQNEAVDEVSVIVFADRDIVGHHPGIVALAQQYSYVDIGDDETQRCVARLAVADYDEVDIGQGSHLVTAALRCLGLGVRPGGSVALLRSGPAEQASIVFHQAGDDRPVPPDATETALVGGWSGAGWADDARVVTFPDPSPRTDWPANAALRTLGVRRDGSPDEATAIGLDLRLPPPT
jgi:hypothetical protein